MFRLLESQLVEVVVVLSLLLVPLLASSVVAAAKVSLNCMLASFPDSYPVTLFGGKLGGGLGVRLTTHHSCQQSYHIEKHLWVQKRWE